MLGAAGWDVAVCDVDERVQGTAEAISSAGGRALALAFDVADPEAAERAHKEAVATLGRVGLVVANAGIVDQIAHADRLTPEKWRHEVEGVTDMTWPGRLTTAPA
jgi:NAD(P)-dependent dehydrogenase (short-subunit alcohol dehydrogenase family)